MENGAKPFGNIWNISNEILDKNSDAKRTFHSDMPDSDKIATNINGYVINVVGNIVAQFGFFLNSDENNEDVLELKISADGFLGRIYNESTNLILGYGHPTGFTGLIDPKFTKILHLGKEAANGDDIIVSIPNDDFLKERGVNFIIRDVDVQLELLSDDVREDFLQSLKDASQEIVDMNEMETAYNSYMRHIYVLLGADYKTNVTQPIEEEYYE